MSTIDLGLASRLHNGADRPDLSIKRNKTRSPQAQQDTLEDDAIRLRALNQNENEQELVVEHQSSSELVDPVTSEGGLWGWIVVAGSTTIFFVVLGLVYSFGVMQSELLRRNYASSSTLGWVSSTTVVFMPLLAIPVTASIKLTSNRTIALLGSLCTGLGYLATSFTFDKPVVFLFLAQSLFGIGYALTFWSCNSLAGQYFVRKRGVAVGIVYAGSGVGGAVFSIILSRLITTVGLEVAVRIYGGIALVSLIPASFTLRSNKEVPVASFKLTYFKDTNFNLLILATALITFSLFVPAFFLPSYAVAAGMSAETGAWLVAGFNLASAVGRIFFGFLADGRVGPLTSLCLAMLLMAISILSIWMASGGLLAPLVCFLLINGAASGALLSLQAPVLSSLYGVSAMSVTLAMVTMSRSFGAALGPAIAGYLLDVSSGGAKAAEEARKAAEMYGRGAGLGTRPFLLPLGVMGGISLIAALCLTILRWRLAGLDLKKRV